MNASMKMAYIWYFRHLKYAYKKKAYEVLFRHRIKQFIPDKYIKI